jgi:hypothetical protein
MAQWIWALIAVILIVLIVAIVLLVNRQRRSIGLQQRFGPEYTRTMESAEDRKTAEAALEDRARRRSELTIVPLGEPVRLRYAEQWRGLQEHFVDRPAEAVSSAEELLGRVMHERGYPVGEFEEQAELISVDHPHVVENYRVAHAIHGRNQAGKATTEDLREAMLRYRSLFDDLLRPDQDTQDAVRGRDRIGADAEAGVDRERVTEVRDSRDVRDVRDDRDLRDDHDVRQEHR